VKSLIGQCPRIRRARRTFGPVERGSHAMSSRPATFRVRRAMPIFNAAISVEYRLVAPCGVPSLAREEIPIVLVSARPGHDVDVDPPPSTLPIFSGMERPLRCGFGWPIKAQSRSLPRFRGHWPASMMLGTSSLPRASSRRTLASAFSANRRATTEPDEPDPQTIKSLCGLSSAVSFCWLACQQPTTHTTR
jgi:hypothetical protein